jgi:osmotically-inducible protein OsmY
MKLWPKAPLLAGTLGVAAVGGFFPHLAPSAPAPGELRDEIVVTAARESDAATTAKVTTALERNPYIFSDHVTVTTENGVVRLGGIVRDLPDLFEILRLARKIAGKGRVINQIEFIPTDMDGN